MKNTGIEYTSEERTPTILPEMQELLPLLTDEQFSLLEANILETGCYAPIIVNEDLVIIDGHNRYEICKKHGLPFRLAVFSFDDLLEAKQWALDTQKSRRNLTVNELCKIAMKLRPEIEARAEAKLHLASGGDRRSEEYKNQGLTPVSNLDSPPKSGVNTRKELADAVGVGEVTMGRAMKIEDDAPRAVKNAVNDGRLTIAQGYHLTKELEQMDELPDEEQEAAAMEAVEREIRRKQESKLKKISEKTRIAKLFNAAFEKAVQMNPTEENVRIWVEQSGILYDQLDRTADDAERISETFEIIADIIRKKIKPTDWRYMNEETEAEDPADCENQDIEAFAEELSDLDGYDD